MIFDVNQKYIKTEQISGKETPVAFIEYREDPAEMQVITGPFVFLPHIHAFETGRDLLFAMREKYPRGDWILMTEPAWSARPEYLEMIQHGIDTGQAPYDKVGTYTPEYAGLLEEWEYGDLVHLNPDGGDIPTTSVRAAMDKIQEEIARLEQP